jgi:AcrR family transcriptional regulator
MPQDPRARQRPPRRWNGEVQDRGEQHEGKRLAILHAAAALFNEKGYHGATLDDLARRLNVTKPALYYYVANKEDILVQCLEVALGELREGIAQARHEGRNGLERLRIFVRHYVALVVGDFGKCLVLSGTALAGDGPHRTILVGFRRVDAAARSMIREGIEDGSIVTADPKIATFALFGALHWITRWYRDGGELSPDAVAERIFAVFEDGLRRRSA